MKKKTIKTVNLQSVISQMTVLTLPFVTLVSDDELSSSSRAIKGRL